MRGGSAREERRAVVTRRLARLGEEMAVLDEPGATEPTHTRIRHVEDRAEVGSGGRPPAIAVVHASSGSWETPGVVGTPSPPAPPAGDGRDGDGRAGPGAVVVPVPGRHAARRRPLAVRGVRLVGLLGPAQLALVAVLVAAALAITCWWLLRSAPTAVPLRSEPTSPLLTALTPAGGDVGPEPTARAEVLVVDVAGRVRHPGIAVLEQGARVVDAIDAAGGARRGVDLTTLNLARPLVDGEQILVGVRGGHAPAPATASEGGGPLVNLNTAGQAELESLPEVGPVTAQAIIAWRDEHGGFLSVDQLVEVDGIGEATLATVSPFVTV